jgi:predicted esterase
MHGSLGNTTQALDALVQASTAGAWWHDSLLIEDDDLLALRDLPEFRQLAKLSQERRSNDSATWTIELPDSSTSVAGVVVALHGAGQSARRAASDWAPVLGLGYALVCVESSQRISPNFRTWLDRDLVIEDVRKALGDLPDALRGVPVLAAGFSDGGRAAVEWALSAEPVPVEGVVVLGPALRELPAAASNPLSPATVLIGTADHLLPTVDAAADQLRGLGFDVIHVPGLGHAAPPDFGERLSVILGREGDSGPAYE